MVLKSPSRGSECRSVPMARVARAVAATNNRRAVDVADGGVTAEAREALDMYPSISSLRSIQVEEEENSMNFQELILAGLKTLYNFTFASCEYAICCLKRRQPSDQPDGSVEDLEIQAMRETLNIHFMNPFQKWNYPTNRRFPWKLLVQIVSIFLVTVQLVLFANSKFSFTTFLQQNQATFSSLFILNPEQIDGNTPLPNPIATLYTREEFQEQINYTINRFFALKSLALGNYGYKWVGSNGAQDPPAIHVTVKKYADAIIDPFNKLVRVTSQNVEDEDIQIVNGGNGLNWTATMSEISQTLSFKMEFEITTIFVSPEPQCFQFTVTIEIQNKFASGNMPVILSVHPDTVACHKSDQLVNGVTTTFLSDEGITILDTIVIIFAIVSIIQCIRSLFNSWKLSRTVRLFFKIKFRYRLKFRQVVPLYNMWFVGVIVSNLLVLVGSVLKLIISYSSQASSLLLVDYTSIMIGLAVFGQWSGLLRFLSYLDKYNMLLLTLRLALPSVIRFIICTGILYIAFLLCGWLVLGSYHPKFRDPFVTSDCLFALINGDDMYATYEGMSQISTPAFVFSKIYLYIFISLFIYVVLSVFISLISDTYETLTETWFERSKGLLIDFASGKLGNAHYRINAKGHAQSHGLLGGHCHTNIQGHFQGDRDSTSHIDLLVDRKDEEDFEYIRDVTMKYKDHHSSSTTVNGGPDMQHSAFRLHNISITEHEDEEEEAAQSPSHTDLRHPSQFHV